MTQPVPITLLDGTRGTVPADQLEAALSSGATVDDGAPTAAAEPVAAPPPPATGPQKLIGPDGLPYTVPLESVPTALQNGWKQPAAIEQEKTDYLKQRVEDRVATKEGERGWGAWHRFGNEALGGIPDLVDTYENNKSLAGQEENAVEGAAEERFKGDHKAEVYTERAAGFAASLALTKGIGTAGRLAESAVLRGAEETLARKIAASAVKVAAEGLLYSTPQAAVEAAYGDHERAAETALWGMGLGGALGAAGAVAGVGAKAASRAAGEALAAGGEAVESGRAKLADVLAHRQADGVTILDNVSRNVLGITDKQAQRLGPERLARIVEHANEEGILSANPQKRAAMVEAILKDSGAKIGDHLEQLDGLLEKEKFHGMGPMASDVAADFRNATSGKFPELGTEIHAPNMAYMEMLDRTIRGAGEKPSFEALHGVRKAIRDEGKAYISKSVKAELAKLADVTIKKHLEDAAQRIYENGGLREQFADYLAQKERYEMASQLAQNINPFKGTGRISPGIGSLGLGTMGNIGLALAGHPVVAGLNIAREHAMKAFLSNKWGLFGKSVSFLRGVAKDPATAPFIGGFMAKEGAAALTSHIDALPSVLSGATKVAGHTASDVVSDIIGDTTGLSKAQQYDRLVAVITHAQADAGATASRVGHVAGAFTGTNVQLAGLVAEKKLNAIAYLQSQIPKDPTTPRAFQHAEWKASQQQQREYLAKATIVANPMTVWKHYQEGKLTRIDKDTLTAVYPVIYQEMVAKIVATAYSPKAPKLTRDQRMQLSTFTGMPMDGSLKNITEIQQALQQPAGGQQPQGGGGPQPSSRPRLKAPGLGTDTQRRTSGGAVQ